MTFSDLYKLMNPSQTESYSWSARGFSSDELYLSHSLLGAKLNMETQATKKEVYRKYRLRQKTSSGLLAPVR